MVPGDWVYTCTEGLEDVTVEEVESLGGRAIAIGDGLVLVYHDSMSTDSVLRTRCHETLGVLVGTISLTGNESDLGIFKMLCHPTLSTWGPDGPKRWDAAVAAWLPARRCAVQEHGLGLSDTKEGPLPEPGAVQWTDSSAGYPDDNLYVGDNGRLERRDLVSSPKGSKSPKPLEDKTAFGIDAILSFRVLCVRTQGSAHGGIKHGFKSVHLNSELGWSIGATHPSWKVDLKRATLTVEVSVRGKLAVVSLQVASSGEARRMMACGSGSNRTATTKPHLAAAMIRLARPGPAEVIVDLGCGMGTIMSEAAMHSIWKPQSNGDAKGFSRVVFGGDLNASSAALAATNLTSSPSPGRFDVCTWSFECLPLRTASQDVLTCDLPFGKAHEVVYGLYQSAMKEVSRVLRLGGRAVLLGMRARFNNTLSSVPLEIRYQKLIDKGGLKVVLLLLERVDEGDWRQRQAHGEAVSLLVQKKRSKEHAERSKERAAAWAAMGAPIAEKGPIPLGRKKRSKKAKVVTKGASEENHRKDASVSTDLFGSEDKCVGVMALRGEQASKPANEMTGK